MTHARRAANRDPLQHLRNALTTGIPSHAAMRAIEDQDDLAGLSAPRRTARVLVPGVTAVVAVAGTAFAVVGTADDAQLEAVPAAATIPDRDTEQTSRSEERPTPAAQTPSADAMAAVTPSAEPRSASTGSAQRQTLGEAAFTPKPTPTPTASETATAEPTAMATTSASSSAKASSSASASSPAVATGSVANCPDPIGWLAPNAQKVYEASCRNFPYVETYGGQRIGDSGAHGTGQAVDIMVSGSRGWDIANYMRANASSLGVTEVIYEQKVWTTQRSSEGWRSMSDRGSATANHMDHVHVTTS